MMRKLLTGAMAALTFATAVVPATGAMARDYRYYRHHRHHDNDGAYLAAGIAGLAIGAALASNSGRRDYDYYGGRRYYRESYYGGGYYRPYYGNRGYYRPYAYDYGGYQRCRTTTRWDPWEDAYIRRTRCW